MGVFSHDSIFSTHAPNCWMARSALHGSSSVMCTLLLLFCTRLSAWREIPELAASEMIATNFVKEKRERIKLYSRLFSPASTYFIRKLQESGCKAQRRSTFSPFIKRSFSLMFTWSMVNPCSARDSYCTLPSSLRTTRPLRPVIYTHNHYVRTYSHRLQKVISLFCNHVLTSDTFSGPPN